MACINNANKKLFHGRSFPNSIQIIKPDSPFIFFVNLSSVLCFVPFSVKWNATKNYFTLRTGKIRQFCCAILHTILLVYNCFVCIDHLKNKITDSYISTSFDLVSNLATYISWINFMRIIWFKRNTIEKIVNFTVTTNLKSSTFKAIKLILVSTVLVHTYFSIDVVALIKKRAIKTNEFPINVYNVILELFKSNVPCGDWFLMGMITYILSFYIISNALIFALSCTMLSKSWEFKSNLCLDQTTEIGRVRQGLIFVAFYASFLHLKFRMNYARAFD